MNSIIWLIVLVVCLIVEASTLGLTTVWFALGSLVAFVAALLNVPELVQYFIFFIVSLVLLYFTRPVAVRYLRIGSAKTNYENLIGKIGIVIETIDNLNAVGQVKLEGQMWTARAVDDKVIHTDKRVVVEDIKGVKLIVKEFREDI